MQKIDEITREQWLACNEFNRNMRDEFLENSTELSPKLLGHNSSETTKIYVCTNDSDDDDELFTD